MDNIGSLQEALIVSVQTFADYYNERKNMKLMHHVEKAVIDNYANPNFSVGFIADILNINPSYLSTAYKDQTGEGVLEFVNRYRVKKSKELLITTALSVEEIAVLVGYSSARILTRMFKKYEDMTPTQFRKSKES